MRAERCHERKNNKNFAETDEHEIKLSRVRKIARTEKMNCES